jgi:malate dehydrogenase (quinone)
VPQSESQRLAARDRYFPDAKSEDWRLQVAGQRVETIKPDARRGGLLELGTALVAAADRSLVALLGASPGASTAAFIAISVLEKCFANELTADGWLPKLRRIIPSYGVSRMYERDCLRRIRAETVAILDIENVGMAQGAADLGRRRRRRRRPIEGSNLGESIWPTCERRAIASASSRFPPTSFGARRRSARSIISASAPT